MTEWGSPTKLQRTALNEWAIVKSPTSVVTNAEDTMLFQKIRNFENNPVWLGNETVEENSTNRCRHRSITCVRHRSTCTETKPRMCISTSQRQNSRRMLLSTIPDSSVCLSLICAALCLPVKPDKAENENILLLLLLRLRPALNLYCNDSNRVSLVYPTVICFNWNQPIGSIFGFIQFRLFHSTVTDSDDDDDDDDVVVESYRI